MTKAVKQSVSKTKNSKKNIQLTILTNNEPDYENNLYFAPKMTWKDFLNYCNENKIENLINRDTFGEYVEIKKIRFYESGTVRIADMIGSITKKRTFEQYKEIVENLYL